MAGLMAANKLANNRISVAIIDKGSGIGGRLATRRISVPNRAEGRIDYGAQFFTVKDPSFTEYLQEWQRAGLIRKWFDGHPTLKNESDNSGHPRYIGQKGMREIAKYLTQNIDIFQQEKVIKLKYSSRWETVTESSKSFFSSVIILTPPLPQSLELLENSGLKYDKKSSNALYKVQYDKCIALMAILDSPSEIPEPGVLELTDDSICWLADNRKKGISEKITTITIHTTPQFSHENWDEDNDELSKKIVNKSLQWLRSVPIINQIHRWRYSRVQNPYPQSYSYLSEPGPLVLAGDAFMESRVEAAALSGIAAANKILQILNN